MKSNQARKFAQTRLEKTLSNTRKSFFYVGLFSMFINVLMLIPSLYMLQVYDRVMSSRSLETLLLLTIIVAVLFATMGILQTIRAKILVRIGNKMDLELNSHLLDVMLHIAKFAPEKASTQPLSDLTKIRQFMTGQGVFAFFDSPWFPVYLFVMYLFSPWFAAFTVFAAIVIFAITMLNEKTTKKGLEKANSANNSAMQYIGKNIHNAEVIHAMGMNENIKNLWLDKHLKFLKIQAETSDVAGRWTNMSRTLRQFFQSLTYGLGAYLAIEGLISPGVIIAGAVLMGRALAPIDLLTNSWKGFSDARGAYLRLNNLFANFPEVPQTMELPDPEGEISVEGIVVVPPRAEVPAIKNVSMHIPAGMAVGIIGPSASGKSTLARAILGLWPLHMGKVRLDGADIHQWNSIKLGPHIGYLPQDIELFEGTISENISRFGELDSKEVVEAAKIAGVHELILQLPHGYDTKIGTGGATLSGGQRQRIGLARVMYKKPSLIVLDEPNSNLDDAGEKALVEAILLMKENKSTIILITHRPNILKVVDNLAVLSQGTLSAYGPKEEILANMQQKAIGHNAVKNPTKSSVLTAPKMTKPGE